MRVRESRLAQIFSRKVRFVLRSVTANAQHTRLLISPLKIIVNAFSLLRRDGQLVPRLSSGHTQSSNEKRMHKASFFHWSRRRESALSLRKIAPFAITNCSANFAKNDYQSFFIRKIPPWSSTLPHYLTPK